jgi:ABC-type glutathione transport system ATPase component
MTTSPADDGMVVSDVSVRFGHREVLHRVSMSVPKGRTVGLVGESGSGKSTLAKAIIGTVPVSHGSIRFDNADLAHLPRGVRREMRRRVQLIPQDPYSSLNPRRTVGQTLAEAIDPWRPRVRSNEDRIVAALEEVSLPADLIHRYPHEFSGGQRQRVAIARALIVRPDAVIADEITSALDVSAQAEVLDLIDELRISRGLTMLFISHNLAVVKQVCDDVAVLYRGDLMETGPSERIFSDPESDYTRLLLESVPGSARFSLDQPVS